jgi:hypothetical protein
MKTLQDLLDRQALADLVAVYSRAVDRREFSILESLYHPDAVHDHGPMFQGKRDDFIAWIKQSPATMTTQHFVGNALHVINGDAAEGEIYTINCHVIGGERDYIAGGRYLDRYVRENGRWYFAARKRLIDWTYEAPSAPASTAAGLARGVNGPGDDSYKMLPNLAAFLSGGR